MPPIRVLQFAALGVALTMLPLSAAAVPAEPTDSPVLKRALAEAQKSIDGCWAESLKDRSSWADALNRRGHARTVVCLKRSALKEMARIFEKGKGLSPKQANQKIDALLAAANSLYWPIYNENVHCGRVCGFANDHAPLSEQADILEILIRTVISLRHSYDRSRYGPDYWK